MDGPRPFPWERVEVDTKTRLLTISSKYALQASPCPFPCFDLSIPRPFPGSDLSINNRLLEGRIIITPSSPGYSLHARCCIYHHQPSTHLGQQGLSAGFLRPKASRNQILEGRKKERADDGGSHSVSHTQHSIAA